MTLVGILTALIAFVIVRSEQWLFDVKEGYCHQGWYKAKRFCCPKSKDVETEPLCSAWVTWAEQFDNGALGLPGAAVEYVAYATIAVCP